jgi:BlaI family transcriptional regulator, penicillinase repressor
MVTHENSVPVARLGELERAVMETLWDLTADWDMTAATTDQRGSAAPRTATARQVSDRLGATRPLAYTTVLTVLDRLERKRLVRRLRERRAHRYGPIATREAYAARLMLEALGRASDRDAALVRFVDAVSPEEAEVLRRALAEGSGEPQGGAPVDQEGSGEPQGGAPVGGVPPDRQESGP